MASAGRAAGTGCRQPRSAQDLALRRPPAHWALPATVRKYTALAPLGSATATVGGTKRICLSEVLPECLPLLAKTLARDIEKGATGKGSYPISGDLTPEIFRDDCRFVDPTNDVTSLAKYRKALTILLRIQTKSSLQIIEAPCRRRGQAHDLGDGPESVGTLQLPWRPKIEPEVVLGLED